MGSHQYHPTSAQHEVEVEAVVAAADARTRILRLGVAGDCDHTPRLGVGAVDCSHHSILMWDVAAGCIHNLMLDVAAAERVRSLRSGVVPEHDHTLTLDVAAERGHVPRWGMESGM
jgi:hypothetical protein